MANASLQTKFDNLNASLQSKLDNLNVESFWEKGYIVIPEVFTPEEIEGYREAALATRATGGSYLSAPDSAKSSRMDGW